MLSDTLHVAVRAHGNFRTPPILLGICFFGSQIGSLRRMLAVCQTTRGGAAKSNIHSHMILCKQPNAAVTFREIECAH